MLYPKMYVLSSLLINEKLELALEKKQYSILLKTL